LRRLERVGRSDSLRTISDTLPRSLVHGDMHPGNIVLRSDGLPVIIDWGNVCVAPPMLDLANIIRIDSTEWDIYLDAYRAAGGKIDAQTCPAPIGGRVLRPLLCIYLGSLSIRRMHRG
jgi:aminoglycoside phosphotransferase (APT) family kinase protein